MYLQAQRVFSVSADRHYRLLHAATEEKPKIIVLTVVVQEAEGLEAKDANVSVYIPEFGINQPAYQVKTKPQCLRGPKQDLSAFAHSVLSAPPRDRRKRQQAKPTRLLWRY
ncbi:conserved hypothetical protein [Culex quinquefasciatus]|uniref:Uncharacterized protein n=1 Tax=Culex quinquefasciatus TaxID=7176 RepID=B0WI95_CULQU|nr:conserved hypothetical protein [Culex quinquefasciatus]|eukprot:XP_001848429.1 conserved hypothetical protein [Culex quinquefasciatus]